MIRSTGFGSLSIALTESTKTVALEKNSLGYLAGPVEESSV